MTGKLESYEVRIPVTGYVHVLVNATSHTKALRDAEKACKTGKILDNGVYLIEHERHVRLEYDESEVTKYVQKA